MEFLFVLVVLFILHSIYSSPKNKGRRGEKRVSRKLKKLVGKLYGYRVLDNVILKTPDGTTQIDHILLTPFGVFVIETKNMSGWIFGGKDQKKWTQVLYKRKNSFQNPLNQNYKHIKAVQQLLMIDRRMIFNVVVFVGNAEFKTPLPENVMKQRKLKSYIHSHTHILFSEEEVDRFATILLNSIKNESISDEQHIRNIKESRNNPLCPRCGNEMILRSAQKGKSAGSKFWGCAKFPICRGTKSIN